MEKGEWNLDSGKEGTGETMRERFRERNMNSVREEERKTYRQKEKGRLREESQRNRENKEMKR